MLPDTAGDPVPKPPRLDKPDDRLGTLKAFMFFVGVPGLAILFAGHGRWSDGEAWAFSIGWYAMMFVGWQMGEWRS